MNKETLEALRASIAHHEAQLLADKPEDVKLGANYCPLCALFNNVTTLNRCVGCPVYGPDYDRTLCSNTPFDDAYRAKERWRKGSGSHYAFLTAQQAEIDFLKALLPTGEA